MSQSTLAPTPAMQIPLSEAFREAFRRHPTGVAVITADPGDQPVAITVSSLISVSAEPPVVAFSLSSRSGATESVLQAESVVIHFLRFTDLELAKLGATRGADRFGTNITWERLPTGEPRYSDVDTWFRARITGRLAVEGATIVAADLIEGAHANGDPEEDASLVYVEQRWHRLESAGRETGH